MSEKVYFCSGKMNLLTQPKMLEENGKERSH